MSGAGLQLRALLAVQRARRLLAREGTAGALSALTVPSASRSRTATSVDRGRALRSVRRAGRVLRTSCLPQAVALAALVGGGSDEPTMVLGCRRYENGVWGAHAWVEIGGDVLDPVPSGDHQVLARCDAAHGWVPRTVDGV